MSSFSDSCAETRFVRFVMWQQLCAGSCFLCFFYLLWFIGSGCLAVDRARCPAMWVASTKKGDHSFGPYSSRCGAFELIFCFLWCAACRCGQHFSKEIWQGWVLGASSAERAGWEGPPWRPFFFFWELKNKHVRTSHPFNTLLTFSFFAPRLSRMKPGEARVCTPSKVINSIKSVALLLLSCKTELFPLQTSDRGPPVQRQPLKHRDYEVDLESRLGKTQVCQII